MSENYGKLSNSLLNTLNIKSERIIAIRENGLADANFILTNLMKQFFIKQNSTCLVILHNTLGHYQNVGKRLEYDFLKKIEDGRAVTLEPMKGIVESISMKNESTDFLSKNKEHIVRELFVEINNKIKGLLDNNNAGQVYLVIDDLSHLLDLDIDVKYVITFLNCCVNLVANDRVSVVINCHVSNAKDEIVSNALGYVADVNIEVLPLETGISHDVTGVINIKKAEEGVESPEQNKYHYKAYDREIKVFPPGHSLFYLYK